MSNYDLFVMYNITEKAQDVPPEWWGHKFGFVAGGMLGAESRRKKSLNDRTAFNEEDQENLYKLVQVWFPYMFVLNTSVLST